jgi:beta-glucosidase
MNELEDGGPQVLMVSGLHKQLLVESASEIHSHSERTLEETVIPNIRPSATVANSEVSQEILSLLGKLTTEEKVALLSGVDFVHTADIQRISIPALKVSFSISLRHEDQVSNFPSKLADSSSAVKGANIHNGTPTACFPCTSALAATWDCSLLEKMGVSIAAQARYKAAQVVLGPTVNIHRDPRAGRNFESFSEDPVLTGWMAASLITGIQSQGVGTCTKHFVANESETLRRKCNSKVDERTLREIYLAPFQWIIREAKPTAIMTSYVFLSRFSMVIEVMLTDAI